MTEVGGKNGEGVLRGTAFMPDPLQGIDGKRMAQTMGGRSAKGDIGDLLFGPVETDGSDYLMKDFAHQVLIEGILSYTGQKIRIEIDRDEGVPSGEIIFDLTCDGLGQRNEPVLSEFSSFNIDRAWSGENRP